MDRCQSTRRQDQFRFALVCYALTLLGSSVTVAEERSSFTWIIQPKGGLVLSGSTFKFNCSAIYFNKHVYYYWKFNDTDIKVNDSSSQFTMRNISNGVQLVIKNVTLKNQGKYECFAKPTGDNTTFNGSAAMLEVKVVETPTGTDEPSNLTWIRHPASQTVDKGSSVTFTCLADCDKLISYHWIANNKTIGENAQPRYKIKENGTLEIARTTEDDKGIYQCFVTTKDGRQKLGESFTAELDVKDQTNEVKVLGSIWKTAGIAVGCAAGYILLMVLLMLYLEHRKTKKEKRRESVAFIGRENLAVETDVEDGNATGSNCVAMNPVFRADPTSEKSQFEFPKHDLVEIMNLGYGAYGHAFLARASGIQDNKEDSMVVVKSLRSEEDRVQREFKEEMKALCGLQHTNVVSLLGVCTLEEPAYIIFELVEKGDLKQYLMSCSHDGRSKLDTNKKQAICSQVLSGMNYLSSKKFVHKDLAARNCMIDRDLNVKIGFLRLSCDVYSAEYCRFNNMQIPLRWMPPEAIFTGKFSEKSDVWSYGVLTWEIFTCGQMPYRDCSNEEALKCIKGDLRLPKPDDCPDTVLEVLQKCWERNPLDRPTFQELSDTSLL